MSNVGYATLQIVPSMRGIENNLTKGISGPAAAAAEKAGEKSGKNYVKAFGASLLVGAGIVTAFGAKAAKTFSDVGGEVSRLSRLTGGSAEEMSKLRFAAHETGIDAETLGSAFGILSKHLGANDKAAKATGIAYRDASGKAKPLNTVLLDLADKFKSMPDGIDKNRLALQLFGRSGTTLLPFLNKGRDGLAGLEAEAKKFGLVLTDDNIAAIKANVVAHREFQAAMQGLQVQVGQYVLPVLTRMSTLATSVLLPAIITVSNFTRDHVGPAFVKAFDIALKVIQPFETAIRNLIAGFTGNFDKIDEAYGAFLIGAKIRADFEKVRAFVEDKVIPAFRDHLFPVLQKIADFAKTNLGPSLLAGLGAGGLIALAPQIASFAGSLGGVIQAIAVLPLGLSLVVVGVAALVAGLVYAYTHSERFRKIVDAVAAFLKDKLATAVDFLKAKWPTFLAGLRTIADFFETKVLPVIQKVAEYLTGQFSNAVAYFQRIFPQVQEAVGHVMNFVRDIITVVINVVSALWRAWGDDLLNIVGTVWNYIQETIENALQIVRGVIQLVLAIINGDWGRAWDAIKQILGGIWDQIGNIISTAFGILRGLFDGGLSTIQQVWSGIWGGLAGVVDGVWVNIQNRVRDGVNSIIDAINLVIKAYNLLPGHSDIKGLALLPDVTHGDAHPFGSDRGKKYEQYGDGGIVGGPRGAPRLILAHGGETVLPTHKKSMGYASMTYVTFNVQSNGRQEGQAAGRQAVATFERYLRGGGAKPSWIPAS